MGKVQVLDDETVNRIAAGEVVDRPASAVKELIENSLDAGAKRITVDIAKGGKASIRVTDDGEGMTRDDALLALERHATSKIRSGDLLQLIQTMGFRGEALPAMAAISRLTIHTRQHGAAEGTQIQVIGGQIKDVQSAGAPEGTTIALEDLYFNTPARRKFLKGDGAETAAVSEVVANAMLAAPQISFKLVVNGEMTLVSPGDGTLPSLARQLFGVTEKDWVELERQRLPGLPYHVSGLLSRPQFTVPSRKGIRLFVNRRPVRSPGASRAIIVGYKNFLPVGRAPLALLFIESPPERVDVNVHPAKLEVRLEDEALFEERLSEVIRSALGGRREPRELLAETSSTDGSVREPVAATRPSPPPRPRLARRKESSESLFERPAAPESPPVPAVPAQTCATDYPAEIAPGLGLTPAKVREAAVPDWACMEVVGQIFSTYILGTSGDTLFIVDQHVAHERVLYEKALGQLSWENIPVQKLLFPVTIQLPRDSEHLIGERLHLLARYGFAAEIYSGGTLVVSSVPILSDRMKPEVVLKDLVAELEHLTGRFSTDEALRRIAATVACRSAIMAGEELELSVMSNLVGDLAQAEHPMTCPHGRPSVLTLTAKDLDRRFLRC